MKIKLIALLLITKLSSAIADTCPPIQNLNPKKPPAGWTLIMPPVLDDQEYYFGSAIHSLSGAFYNGQTLCKYEACPTNFCPAFALLSDKTYTLPNTNDAPWNARSRLKFTFTCTPVDHDPQHCVFQ